MRFDATEIGDRRERLADKLLYTCKWCLLVFGPNILNEGCATYQILRIAILNHCSFQISLLQKILQFFIIMSRIINQFINKKQGNQCEKSQAVFYDAAKYNSYKKPDQYGINYGS